MVVHEEVMAKQKVATAGYSSWLGNLLTPWMTLSIECLLQCNIWCQSLLAMIFVKESDLEERSRQSIKSSMKNKTKHKSSSKNLAMLQKKEEN